MHSMRTCRYIYMCISGPPSGLETRYSPFFSYERPSLSHTHTKKQTTNTDKLCLRTPPPPTSFPPQPSQPPQLGLLGTHLHTQ